MSEPRRNRNPTYPLGTFLWVKLLKRVWWPGTVVDPLTTPQELLDYVKKVEPISCVVKFNEDREKDEKYHVVELYEEVYLYSCDRKIEFIEKGFSLYQNQQKGLGVIGKFNMNNFLNEVISMEELIGGDKDIFKHVKEDKEKFKSYVKGLFTPMKTKKSKKKEVERKSLPAPKLPITPKTPNQPKPKPRTSTRSQFSKTYKTTTSIGFSCHSQVGCNFTTKSYDNLKRHMVTHKKDTGEVTTQKSSNSSTSNKRKNIKTKPSAVKKQKLQEELLKDWDNDGEDEDEEIKTSGVQSSSNFAQSSDEKVLQTMNQSSSNVVQSSNEEVLSSKDDTVQIISKDISRNREVQETSTCSPNRVFDFTENDNNTPVVELRQSKSYCSSIADDLSESFESRITQDFINTTIFDVLPRPESVSELVEECTEKVDNQTKSTELLLEKTDNTLDQINNFENSLSCISSSINNSDANILTEDDNVVLGKSDLSECGSLNKTASPYKDIKVDTTNDVGIPLVENMSTEAEDSAIVEENTNDKEIVSNDKEVNQLNGTTIDKNMPIENSCSVDSTSNKIDCEDKIIEEKKFLDDIPKVWCKDTEWESTKSAAKDLYFVNSEEPMNIPAVVKIDQLQMESDKLPLPELYGFRSGIQDTRSDYIFGDTFDVFIPRSELGRYAEANELTVDNADDLRTALLNLISRLNMTDQCT